MRGEGDSEFGGAGFKRSAGNGETKRFGLVRGVSDVAGKEGVMWLRGDGLEGGEEWGGSDG